mgnify:CR=1 FL=1
MTFNISSLPVHSQTQPVRDYYAVVQGLDGAGKVAIDALGEHYEQVPFKYQHKCWNWLLDELAEVRGEPRVRLQRILEEAGCWKTLVDPL